MIRKYALMIIIIILSLSILNAEELPVSFDLRNVDSLSFVSPVRSQQGGTCWTHGTIAAIESNMLRSGLWISSFSSDSLNLSEYHLDWWNGFNLYYNEDFPFSTSEGLEVHMGGDYRVSSAYLSRGDGAVLDTDAPTFENPSPRRDNDYTYYYPRHIEWFTLKEDMSNLNDLKRVIMDHGAVGTCMYVGSEFLDDSTNGSFYQPPSDLNEPNHSIAIIGWNDTITTAAPLPGAWLCKNSWGDAWGENWNGHGYFWISFYDKYAARHPEMGFVSFRDVELMNYDTIYYHDYHGWRDELEDIDEAANIFVSKGNDTLTAVSFFTAAEMVNYTLKVYLGRQKAVENDPVISQSGYVAHTGFHTVDLAYNVQLVRNDTFVVSVSFDKGAYPYDRSSVVPVLLDVPSIYGMPSQETWVPSKASMNESMFKVYDQWVDFQYLDQSANFCIKALINQETVTSAVVSKSTESSFLIYPNPSPGRVSVNFELPSAAKVKISLYDLKGNLLRVVNNKSYPLGYNVDNIDFSNLSNGLYLCILEVNGNIVNTQRIMVLK